LLTNSYFLFLPIFVLVCVNENHTVFMVKAFFAGYQEKY